MKREKEAHLCRAISVLTCAGGALRNDGTPAPRLLLPALNSDDEGLMVSVDFHESVLDVVAVLLRTEASLSLSFRVIISSGSLVFARAIVVDRLRAAHGGWMSGEVWCGVYV
jgi:hypothetical protein